MAYQLDVLWQTMVNVFNDLYNKFWLEKINDKDYHFTTSHRALLLSNNPYTN